MSNLVAFVENYSTFFDFIFETMWFLNFFAVTAYQKRNPENMLNVTVKSDKFL